MAGLLSLVAAALLMLWCGTWVLQIGLAVARAVLLILSWTAAVILGLLALPWLTAQRPVR